MNYENKHRIESLAKAACPNNKKVSVIFRSKENKLSDRPNAFIVTVGKQLSPTEESKPEPLLKQSEQ